MDTEADIFREEACELLEDIEQVLLELRDKPADGALIARLFRDIHTIKGSGAMFGFDRVADFAHKFETAIDAVRQGEAVLTEDLLNNLLMGRDHILKLIETPEDDLAALVAESERLIAGLNGDGNKELAQDESAPDAKKEAPLQNKIGELKILIVEDEFVSRYLLQEFMMKYGISHVAVNGFEAIIAFKRALSERKPYDMICLDIMMPGMDGKAVAKEVRRLETELGMHPPCRIVMTTAVHEQEIISELLAEKFCDAYLTKPLNLEIMRGKLTEFFGR